MKKTDDANAQALPDLLRAARRDVDELRKKLLRELTTGTTAPTPVSTGRVIGLVHQYGAALVELTSVEDQIEQDSSTKYGLVQGDAVDLQQARQDVLDRITRFRDRGGS